MDLEGKMKVFLMFLCLAIVESSKLFTYKVIDEIEHNSQYFVEGLVFHENNLILESVGLRGKSKLVLYDTLGTELASHTLSSSEFAEGITFFEPEANILDVTPKLQRLKYIAQLTYKKGFLHLYALHSTMETNSHEFEYLGNVNVPKDIKEGWGLTTTVDKRLLIAGDGSSSLYFLKLTRALNGLRLEIVKTVTVHDCSFNMKYIKGSNELEAVPYDLISTGYDLIGPLSPSLSPEKQYIWTNIIGTWCIAVIDIDNSGEVVAWIDLDSIDHDFSKYDRVANGIAFSYSENSVWVTGKRWSKSYKIELIELDSEAFNPSRKCKTPWSPVTSHLRKKTCSQST